MDHLEAAGWIARDRGCGLGSGAVTLRPKDATVTFVPPGGVAEVLSYDALISEGVRLRSEAQGTLPPPRSQHYSFEFRSVDRAGR